MNHSNVIVILLLLLIITVPENVNSDQEQDLLAKGVAAYENQDYSSALQYFDKVIMINPSLPYGWLWKGTVLQSLGRIEESETVFKTGRCLLDPDQCSTSQPSVSSSSDRGMKPSSSRSKTEETSHNFELNTGTKNEFIHLSSVNTGDSTSPKISPGDPRNSDSQGLTSSISNENMSDEFSESLKKILAENPEDPSPYKTLGDTLVNSSPEKAIDAYNLASLNDNRDSDLFQRKGDVERQLGRKEEAMQSYAQGLKMDPDNPDLFERLGDMYSQKNMTDSAQKEYSKGLSHSSDSDHQAGLLKKMIRNHQNSGNFEAAKDLLGQLSRLPAGYGDTPEVAEMRGDLNFRSGKFDDAAADFIGLWRSNPENTELGLKAAESQLNAGKANEAQKILEKISALPLNSFQRDQFKKLNSRISHQPQSDTPLFPSLSSAGYLWLLLPLGVVIVVLLYSRRML